MFCCCWKTNPGTSDKIKLTVLLSSIKSSDTTNSEKKAEFWETQVQGKKEVWDALKAITAAESLDFANAILTSLNLTIAHADYHLEFKVWDEYGDAYVVPAWVYGPSKIENEATIKIQTTARDPDTSLKVRLSTGAQDLNLRVHKEDLVFTIIHQILENLSDKNTTIKLFYLGKLLEIHKKIIDVVPSVADQEIIIQAMVMSK